MTTTIYYAPDAVGSLASIFTDGTYLYERVHQIGSLGALDGWLRRIGKKFKRGIKKFGKGIAKVAKKVGKVAVKVVKTALPIVNTALTFIPGVGWAAKAALTVAEEGIKAIDKASKRRKQRKLQKKLNSMNTRLAKRANKVKPTQRIDKAPISQINQVKLTRVKPAPPRYSAIDFMRINAAVNRDRVKVDDVVNIVRNQVKQNY